MDTGRKITDSVCSLSVDDGTGCLVDWKIVVVVVVAGIEGGCVVEGIEGGGCVVEGIKGGCVVEVGIKGGCVVEGIKGGCVVGC